MSQSAHASAAGFEPAVSSHARPGKGPASVPVAIPPSFAGVRRTGKQEVRWEGDADPCDARRARLSQGWHLFPSSSAIVGLARPGRAGARRSRRRSPRRRPQPASSRFCLPDAGFEPAVSSHAQPGHAQHPFPSSIRCSTPSPAQAPQTIRANAPASALAQPLNRRRRLDKAPARRRSLRSSIIYGGIKRYGTRTPSSPGSKSLVLRVTSTASCAFAVAQMIASGKRSRWVRRNRTANSAIVSSSATISKRDARKSRTPSSSLRTPAITSIQVMWLISTRA